MMISTSVENSQMRASHAVKIRKVRLVAREIVDALEVINFKQTVVHAFVDFREKRSEQ
jgi:hypothetical protein